MDFLGGALPNVMFIVGMLAIGLGLGIELKLVPLKKEIDRTGRIGAIVVGAVLVAGSVYFYLNPGPSNRTQTASGAASPGAATAVTAPVAASLPTAAPMPTAPAETTQSAVAQPTSAATETPVPTVAPPTQVPQVVVPDLHGLSEDKAKDKLQQAHLQAKKAAQCNGSDQGDPKPKKRSVQCQNPAAGTAVPPDTVVEYVLQH